jgi:hypothetical protein
VHPDLLTYFAKPSQSVQISEQCSEDAQTRWEPNREQVLSMERQSGGSGSIPSKQIFSFGLQTVGRGPIPTNQRDANFLNGADQDSTASKQFYSFT